MKLSKSLIIWLVVAVVLIVIYFSLKGTYNNIVTKNEGVKSQWANVENVYQRRADLIPNLVNTVKGYAEHEKETLTKVIEARAKATSMNVNFSDENSMKEFQAAQSQVSSSLSRLLVSVEQYPDLKANQNFLDLQAQLEGTENRITVERKNYNDIARDFNTYIKKFPNVIIANLAGFNAATYYEAEEGSEKAPEVKF